MRRSRASRGESPSKPPSTLCHLILSFAQLLNKNNTICIRHLEMPKEAFSNLLLTSGLLLGLPLLFSGYLRCVPFQTKKYKQRSPASDKHEITSYLLSHISNFLYKNACIYFHGTINRPFPERLEPTNRCVAVDQDLRSAAQPRPAVLRISVKGKERIRSRSPPDILAIFFNTLPLPSPSSLVPLSPPTVALIP